VSEININTSTVVISRMLHVEHICILQDRLEHICILQDRLGTPVQNLSPLEAIEFETIPTLRMHLE
jgi:hypothetical protein